MKIKNKIIIGFIIMLSILTINIKVHAASASISASSTSVTSGTEVVISANVSGAVWNVSISGPVSNSFAATTEDAENHNTVAGTVRFVPNTAGSYTFNLSGTVADKDDSEPTEVKVPPIVINVTEPTTRNDDLNENTSNTEIITETPVTNTEPEETKKSSNANLSNLGFTPTDFKGFKPWKTEYSATVKGDVEQISVYATLASDSKKAKITTGTGTHKLNEGNNSIKVVVTAEDGTTKTYTINVTREKKTENTTTEENTIEETNTVEEETAEQENKNSDLIKLEVVGATLSPKFSPDIYEYKVNVNSDVNDLDVKAEGANENIQIEIAGNKDLKDGENTITILVHNNEKNTDLTYQIIATKALLNVDGVNTTLNDAVKKANRIRTILIAVGIVIIVGIIIFFIARHKIVEDEKENDKYEYDEEDDDDTLDLDGEEELFKRVNKEEFKRKLDEDNNKTQEIQNSEIKANIASEVDDDIDEERYEFFRTSIEKRKGKHF